MNSIFSNGAITIIKRWIKPESFSKDTKTETNYKVNSYKSFNYKKN